MILLYINPSSVVLYLSVKSQKWLGNIMLSRYLTYRALNIYASIFIIVILTFAIYTQLYQGQLPCPLCIMQRITFILLAVLFIIGSIFVPRNLIRRTFQGLIFLVALLGIAIATRHVYLQHLPVSSATSCSPSFNFILENLPPNEAIRLLLMGSSDCATVSWHLFGLTMPEWSLLCFLLLAIVSIIQIARKNTM